MLRAAVLAGVLTCAGTAWAQSPPPGCIGPITGAAYSDDTDRYPHGALGDPVERGTLEVDVRLTAPCAPGKVRVRLVLPRDLVFEDVTPVLADLDGDGAPEVVTVESHRDRGARLAVYALRDGKVGRVAATPHIGQTNRWMAQAGAGDLDGDGRVEVAAVDRPHLAKVLRVWRLVGDRLEPVAAEAGFTNHRFGDRAIQGGVRSCGGGDEVLAATADWTRILASRVEKGRIVSRDLGPYSAAAMADAMACR